MISLSATKPVTSISHLNDLPFKVHGECALLFSENVLFIYSDCVIRHEDENNKFPIDVVIGASNLNITFDGICINSIIDNCYSKSTTFSGRIEVKDLMQIIELKFEENSIIIYKNLCFSVPSLYLKKYFLFIHSFNQEVYENLRELYNIHLLNQALKNKCLVDMKIVFDRILNIDNYKVAKCIFPFCIALLLKENDGKAQSTEYINYLHKAILKLEYKDIFNEIMVVTKPTSFEEILNTSHDDYRRILLHDESLSKKLRKADLLNMHNKIILGFFKYLATCNFPAVDDEFFDDILKSMLLNTKKHNDNESLFELFQKEFV